MLESKAKELSLYGERLVRNLSTALSKWSSTANSTYITMQ
jgi:hypothetical protein